MNKRAKLLPLILTMSVAGLLFGCSPYNKVRLQSGSFTFLKQQQEVNVEYEYEGLRVGRYKKKSVPEEEYVQRKVAEHEKKAPGTGEHWRNEWAAARTLRYQPKFEELFNKQFAAGNLPLQFGTHRNAMYTLVLKSKYLEPGWHAGIMAKPALLTADAVFVETQNRNNTLATVSVVNMTGMDAVGVAFDMQWRMQESYAKAGKDLGIFIRRKLK